MGKARVKEEDEETAVFSLKGHGKDDATKHLAARHGVAVARVDSSSDDR